MTVNIKTPAVSKIETVALEDLEAYEKNPRKNDDVVDDMVKLIERFGFRVPILKRGNRIVDGHLRVKAARALNMDKVPAIDVGDMSEADERALRIALNKSVEWAEWDEDLLAEEFVFLRSEDFDLSLTGFDTTEVDAILKNLMEETATPEPETEPKQEEPTTKSKDADAGTPADPNYVSVTFHMAASSREKILTALDHVRKQNELSNVSQALVHVASNIVLENDLKV